MTRLEPPIEFIAFIGRQNSPLLLETFGVEVPKDTPEALSGVQIPPTSLTRPERIYTSGGNEENNANEENNEKLDSDSSNSLTQNTNSINSPQAVNIQLKFSFLAHMTLDVFAARALPKSGDMDLGLLFVQDETAVYGYLTNTNVKIIVGLSLSGNDSYVPDLSKLFKALHRSYISLACNPFYIPESRSPVKPGRFVATVRSIGNQWNSVE